MLNNFDLRKEEIKKLAKEKNINFYLFYKEYTIYNFFNEQNEDLYFYINHINKVNVFSNAPFCKLIKIDLCSNKKETCKKCNFYIMCNFKKITEFAKINNNYDIGNFTDIEIKLIINKIKKNFLIQNNLICVKQQNKYLETLKTIDDDIKISEEKIKTLTELKKTIKLKMSSEIFEEGAK